MSTTRKLILGCLLSLSISESAGVRADEEAASGPAAPEQSTELKSAVASSEGVQRYHLAYRFEPGSVLRYQTQQNTTMEAMVHENRKIDRSSVTQRRLFTVQDVTPEGTAHVTMQFEHVRMQLQANDAEPVVFESTMSDREIPVMFRMAADRLKGKAARYHVDNSGRAVTAAETAGPSTATGNTEAAEAASADDGTFLMPLPEQDVQVGDTWKDAHTVSVRVTKDINRRIDILRTFRLQSVEGDVATISFNSSVASPVSSSLIRAQLMQSTPKGTMVFDLKRGLMLRKHMRFDQTVLNAMGENTVVTSFGEIVEELLPAAEIKADASPEKPAPAAPALSAR